MSNNNFGVRDKTQIKILGVFMIIVSVVIFFFLLTPNLNDILSWVLLIYCFLLIPGGIGLLRFKNWGRLLAIGLDIGAIVFIVFMGVLSLRVSGMDKLLDLLLSLILPLLIYSLLVDSKIKKLFR
ncbi:hypothetical protein GOQ27_16200 [Clostridium sp. D2Q-11]|uniref:Uncharacterized protein n=1 Tax=Anaeromonas frigoriresistens TaxID=2683708 RepID=A0A942ZAQ9_9FIRM|nr:hypothetical protein [Anaeromonas frigoriresistens]MBS4540020.1 hypothetical protein [Anaeromonas frigoriresistens]